MNMPRPSMLWIYGLIGAFIIGWYVFGDVNDTPLPSDWTTVREMVEKGDVEKIQVVNRDQAQVFLKKEAAEQYRRDTVDKRFKRLPETGVQLTFTIGSVDSFREDLKNAEQQSGQTVPVVYENKTNDWTNVLINLLPWVLIIGVWIFIMRSMSRGAGGGAGGGIMNVGKAKAQVFDKDASKRVTFKDVAGLEEAKVEIMEIVDFLKKSEKYKELGAKIPKGALLVGPPGTGKTLLAKAVAGEANVPFLSISGSDFVEMFVGVGASRVRDLFEQAKQKAPCIVFIDEIDAIGRARGKNAGFSGNDERENTLNQLLTEMDGFQTNTGVIVLAATNRADILDKALMRAGRFDRQIEVGLPDVKEREEIFNVHLRPLKLDPQLDRSFLARQTPGFSGADIANVCNEAALIAARHNKKFISKEDFLAAIDRIVGGLERKNKIITDEEKRVIAFHEAGHATVSWILENASPLIKVTIIPRGKALGAAWYLPEERQITTREQMMDELAATLGGRVSEQLTFGEISRHQAGLCYGGLLRHERERRHALLLRLHGPERHGLHEALFGTDGPADRRRGQAGDREGLQDGREGAPRTCRRSERAGRTAALPRGGLHRGRRAHLRPPQEGHRTRTPRGRGESQGRGRQTRRRGAAGRQAGRRGRRSFGQIG